MEEKERYKLESYNEAFCQIHDTESGEWYLRKDLVTDLLNQQDKQIKELEEQAYPAYKREHKRRAYLENIEVPRLEKENEQLKQQLDEKDKEIEQLKKFDDLNKTFFNLFRIAVKEPDKVDDLFNIIKTMQEKQDQDKISFVVEWLEKVKEVALKDFELDKGNISLARVLEEIDNQIKELKEMDNV